MKNIRLKSASLDQQHSRSSGGFILPALIVFSLALMSIGLVALQYISSSTSATQSSYYTSMAKTAGDAGLNQAISCIRNGEFTWTNTAKLQPNTDCAGVVANPSLSESLAHSSTGSWRSSFEVSQPEETASGVTITSTGKVDFYYAGSSTPSKSFTHNSKVSIPGTLINEVRPIAQGTAVTSIEGGGYFSCAVANQSPYCWGKNNQRQTASVNSTSPTYVYSGSLADKRVTSMSLGPYNTCALAEGRAHCWGPNSIGQMGNGGTSGPVMSVLIGGGDLGNRNIQKITVGKSADQGNPSQYTCAVAGVKVYCWGANNYAQLGQAAYDCVPILGCVNLSTKPLFTSGIYNATKYSPVPVFGYANRQFEDRSQIKDKAPYDLQGGAYGTCIVTNGQVFCWGDRAVSVPLFDNGGTDDSSGWKNGSLSGKAVTAISGGESTVCAAANSQLHCWGQRPGDGYFVIGGASPLHVRSPWIDDQAVTAVAHSDDLGPVCALAGSEVYCWGESITVSKLSPQRISDAPSYGAVTAIGAGRNHGCMVANGSSYCFGYNSDGQLGNGTTSGSSTPTLSPVKTNNIGLTSGEAATDIATGGNHSCAVANGYIYCWGQNTSGQLGTGNLIDRATPIGIIGITEPAKATNVTAGDKHSCGIINGKAYCWGDNTFGQLGNGTTDSSSTPVAVGGPLQNQRVTSLSAGTNHTCAVSDGVAYCWGDNSKQQSGASGWISPTYTTPRPVSTAGLLNGQVVTKISAGGDHTCAIANQQGYCWGQNTNGQLGDGTVGGSAQTPRRVNAPNDYAFFDIATGDGFTCAIINGYSWCWGLNSTGQLGRSSTPSNQGQVLRVGTPDNRVATEITAGKNHACSISNGVATCWGQNTDGKLGNGNTTNAGTPVSVTATAAQLGSNYPYKIAAGGSSTCAIGNAKITCWGNGTHGQIGNNTTPVQQLTPSSWTSDYTRQERTVDLSNAIYY